MVSRCIFEPMREKGWSQSFSNFFGISGIIYECRALLDAGVLSMLLIKISMRYIVTDMDDHYWIVVVHSLVIAGGSTT